MKIRCTLTFRVSTSHSTYRSLRSLTPGSFSVPVSTGTLAEYKHYRSRQRKLEDVKHCVMFSAHCMTRLRCGPHRACAHWTSTMEWKTIAKVLESRIKSFQRFPGPPESELTLTSSTPNKILDGGLPFSHASFLHNPPSQNIQKKTVVLS